MKKTIIFITLCFLSILLLFLDNHVSASQATTYTVSIDTKGRFVRTQDAYLPDSVLNTLGLSKPEDMMFDEDNMLWIADGGNQRIIKYNTYTNQVIQEVKYSEFKEPKGIFVSDRGLYVADPQAKAVFRLTHEGVLVEKFERPTSPSFADTPFAPSKLVVDNRGNIYIYGEGVSNGIIQLSNTGEFLGFFTTNKVTLSFMQQFYKRILSQAQFDRLASRSPQTFSSIFIDKNSMIYTSTTSTKNNAVKKHNMQGGNIFSETVSSDDAQDLYVDQQGIIYAGMQSGAIFIYNAAGEYIFSFGVNKADSGKITDDIAGIFSKLSAIAVRNDGHIFALDIEKASLQSFKPTSYANKIYEAINLYEQRAYDESIVAWNEVLRLNQMSIIAHNNIAKSYLQLENYEKANEHFKLAGNRIGYSESFWEVRNQSIQSILGIMIIGVVVAFALVKVLSIIDQKNHKISTLMIPIKEKLHKKIIIDLLYLFKVMRTPSDGFYELKRKNKGSLVSAFIIYLLVFVAFIIYSSSKGFIYQTIAPEDLDLSVLVLGYFVLTSLFVIANYLDTSLHDGIGDIKQIFMMFTYSLGPIFVALISTTILSHILTFNEVFFLDMLMLAGGAWTGILIFIGIIETHEYTGKKALQSVLMTIIFILVVVVVIIIVLTMGRQLLIFLESIIKELIRNVFG